MASDAASHFGLPLQGPAPDGSERRERARSVSADLEAIFGQPGACGAASRPGPVGRAPRRSLAMSAPRRLSAASLGGLAAAALVGIAAGSLLVSAPHARAPALPRPDALPVDLVAPHQTPTTSDAVLAAPTAPVEVADARVAARRLGRPKARPASVSASQVRAADRRLRAAYDAAIHARAPRDMLVSYRDRWAGIRRREAHNPARLAASYDALAVDLNRAAREHGHGRAGRAAGRSPFHLRFAPWWR